MYVNEFLLRKSLKRFKISACTETSSAEVGSSKSKTLGSGAKARAIATR